jgi:hypothetical protein
MISFLHVLSLKLLSVFLTSHILYACYISLLSYAPWFITEMLPGEGSKLWSSSSCNFLHYYITSSSSNKRIFLIWNYFVACKLGALLRRRTSLKMRFTQVLWPLNVRQISMGKLPHCWLVTVTTACMGGHCLGNIYDDPCMLQDTGYFVFLF